MTRIIISIAFLLGAVAVVWMGWGFVGSGALALTVTAVIGAVYVIGFIELLQFRQATATLSNALVSESLSTITNSAPDNVSTLDLWLNKLHPSLQNAVRLRIEGERVGLPAPVLVPYLVGLLVMLGLLGTFVGMVETLKGAVIALEGTSELEAIRAALAAPIKGLGLAFGTSVAGVAASAMLGLISTLSRRDRMIATRQLDSLIPSVFRDFSLIHNRQATFRALQIQAEALPEVAEKLNVMAGHLERMGDNLGSKLIDNQQHFHESVTSIYSEFAYSIGESLKESLAENGRIAAESSRQVGESIKPVVQEAMDSISAEIKTSAQNTHQQLTTVAQTQLETLTEKFSQTSEQVACEWKEGLAAHERSNETLIGCMSDSFYSFNDQFKRVTAATIESLDKTTMSWVEHQHMDEKQRVALWLDALEKAQMQATTQLTDASKRFTDELTCVVDRQQSSINAVTQSVESMSCELTTHWRQAGQETILQQQKIAESLGDTARDITVNAQTTSANMLTEMTRLLKSSEGLLQNRLDSEESWLARQDERFEKFVEMLKVELSALRDEEARRGQAAVSRLGELESTVATHLGNLGKTLEEPMTQLIHTASETPRAAAEVIGHLRREISNNIERDNKLLEERSRIMDELNQLSISLEQSAKGQGKAIEALVNSSANMLKDVSAQFSDHVSSGVSTLSEVADNFAVSATEISSLGEAFSLAVQLFNESNSHLIESLKRIEESLDNSTARSDEQLGYYVAQAREIIDHSMMSQKEIFEEMRQLSQKEDLIPAEVD